VAFILSIGCKTTMRSITSEARPLSFVGEVEFGIPAVVGDQVVVSLIIRGGEWRRHSVLVPKSVTAVVRGQEIDLTVHSEVATGESSDIATVRFSARRSREVSRLLL